MVGTKTNGLGLTGRDKSRVRLLSRFKTRFENNRHWNASW